MVLSFFCSPSLGVFVPAELEAEFHFQCFLLRILQRALLESVLLETRPSELEAKPSEIDEGKAWIYH